MHPTLNPYGFTFMPDSPDLVQGLPLREPMHGQRAYAERLVCFCRRGDVWTGLFANCLGKGTETSIQQRRGVDDSKKHCLPVAYQLLSMQVSWPSKPSQVGMTPIRHIKTANLEHVEFDGVLIASRGPRAVVGSKDLQDAPCQRLLQYQVRLFGVNEDFHES